MIEDNYQEWAAFVSQYQTVLVPDSPDMWPAMTEGLWVLWGLATLMWNMAWIPVTVAIALAYIVSGLLAYVSHGKARRGKWGVRRVFTHMVWAPLGVLMTTVGLGLVGWVGSLLIPALL